MPRQFDERPRDVPGMSKTIHALQEGSDIRGVVHAGRDVKQGNDTTANNCNIVIFNPSPAPQVFHGEMGPEEDTSREERPFEPVQKPRPKRKFDKQWTDETRPRKQTQRSKWVYRVTGFDINESKESIREALRNYVSGKPKVSLEEAKQFKILHSLDSQADQTAVVVYNRKPARFPDQRVGREDSIPLKEIGRFQSHKRPRVDSHFHHLTFLSSPFREPIESSSGHPWDEYLKRLGHHFEPGLSRDIRYDVVILAPPGNHPYGFWMGGTGDKSMWVVDFLVNEGFDATRISVFAASNWNQKVGERLDAAGMRRELAASLEKLARQCDSQLSHSILLIEFIQQDLEFSLSNELTLHLTNSLKGRLQVLHVIHDESQLTLDNPYEQLKTLELRSDSTLQFERNDDATYREVVAGIWDSLHTRPAKGQSRSWRLPWGTKQTVQLDREHFPGTFAKMCEIVDGFRDAINPVGGDGKAIRNDARFFDILNNRHYKDWENEPRGAALRIVTSPDKDLSAFCKSLSDHHDDHQVFHLDCAALRGNGGPERRNWPERSPIGLLILRIFKAVIEGLPQSDHALACLFASLDDKTNQVRCSEGKGNPTPFDKLLLFLEQLGSGIVHVIHHALAEYFRYKPLPGNCRPLMLILSGLDALDKSPELGRLVYCICKLHDSISIHRVCKLLITHKERLDLEGLLKDIGCLKDDEYQDCLASLNAGISRPSRRRRAIAKRYDTTLEWFWGNDEYRKWSEPGCTALLILYGKPGCGKSVLSRFVLDNMKRNSRDVVAPFFFNIDRNCSAADYHDDMLRTLLHSILDQAPDLFPHYQAVYLELKRQAAPCDFEWTQAALEHVLTRLTSHQLPKTIYILIDGLDESGGGVPCAEGLVKFLPEKGSEVSVKLLVATQRNFSATNKLKDGWKSSHEVHEVTLQDKNSTDIEAYIKSFLNKTYLKSISWEEQDLEDCRQILIDKAQGIFLWAKLAKSHVDDYLKGTEEATKDNFKSFLDGIPRELMDLYHKLFDRMVRNINNLDDERRHGRIKRVRAMLQVAIQAYGGSLLVEEFRDAYIVPSSENWYQTSIGGSRSRNIQQTVSEFTANFLEVHWNGSDYVVQLAHQTAAQFLQKQAIEGVPLGEGASSSELSTMASACIYYLELVSSDLGSCKDSAQQPRCKEIEFFATRINEYPLLPYALDHLKTHVEKDMELHGRRLENLLGKMRDSKVQFLIGSWIRNWEGEFGISTEQIQLANDVLHFAAAQHLSTAVKVALRAGAEPSSPSTIHRSGERALCLLAMSSPPSVISETDTRATPAEIAIARTLIAFGAQVDAPTQYQGTALHYAGKFNKPRLVEELIRKHARVNCRDAQGMTPLHRTIIGLQESPGSLKRDARGRPPRTASEKCVKILIQAGADLRAADNQGHMPIHWAAGLMDRDEILVLLIKASTRGESCEQAVDQRCLSKHTTALHWACGHGYLNHVKVLVNHGANLRLADGSGKTALHWAAKYGYSRVLAGLLTALNEAELASVIDGKSSDGRTPLICASIWGHTECVKQLVKYGANVNLAEGDKGSDDIRGTPLSWAVTCGHSDIIKFLIEKGAVVDETLLGWAAARGNIKIFKKILGLAEENHQKLGVDAVESGQKSPFMLAAAHGHLPMVKFLCGRYKDEIKVHRRDHESNTALHLAAKWDHLEMVRWLVEEAKLGINQVNMFDETPLDRAIRHEAKEVEAYLCRKMGKTKYDDRTARW